MSKELSKVILICVDRYFGEVPKLVAEVLLDTGIASLGMIHSRVKVDLPLIKKSLTSLIRHSIVYFEPMAGSIDLVGYRINKNRAMSLLRYYRFIGIVSEMGFVHRLIFEEILRFGQITLSKFLFYYGSKYYRDHSKISVDDLTERLVQHRKIFIDLSRKKYIYRSDELCRSSESDSSFIPRLKPYKDSVKHSADTVNVDIKSICRGIINGESPKEGTFSLDEPLWEVHLEQFSQEIRNEMVLEMLTKVFTPQSDSFSTSKSTEDKQKDPIVDIRIPKIVLELGMTKEYLYDVPLTPLIDYAEIKSSIQNLPNNSKTLQYFDDNLYVLLEDSQGIFLRTSNGRGGAFNIDNHVSFTLLTWSTIEKIIIERHGFFAARIFRVIKINKFVEEERIHELAMIPAKEAKHLTYLLVQDNFVTLKEVRKTYTASSAATQKSVFIFTIEINKVVYTQLEYCYKSYCKLESRLQFEKGKCQRLIEKEQKLEKVLAKMEMNGCPREQIEEMQDYITEPERAIINVFKPKNEKLTRSAFLIEDTMFVFQQYLKYEQTENILKLPPKHGKREVKAEPAIVHVR